MSQWLSTYEPGDQNRTHALVVGSVPSGGERGAWGVLEAADQ